VPSPNPSNPFATATTTHNNSSIDHQQQHVTVVAVNPFASNYSGGGDGGGGSITSSSSPNAMPMQPTSSNSVASLSHAHSAPIVKQEGVLALPIVTQTAADNPFRPQQNSFLGMDTKIVLGFWFCCSAC
jgi:hypothetical protein